jgi:hypothetical protein
MISEGRSMLAGSKEGAQLEGAQQLEEEDSKDPQEEEDSSNLHLWYQEHHR